MSDPVDVPLPDGTGGTIVQPGRISPEHAKLRSRETTQFSVNATMRYLAETNGISRNDMAKIIAEELRVWMEWDK
jgi:hypothetical protein